MKLKEYSKRVLRWMILLWFFGAGFGGVVIVVELVATLVGIGGYSMAITVHLPELLTYISMPMSCGVLGYLLKAGFENREKIRKSGGNPSFGGDSPENQDFGGGYDGNNEENSYGECGTDRGGFGV